jgi:hypothetical protein
VTLSRAAVGPLPLPVADSVRRALARRHGTVAGRVGRAALRRLYAGGIPRAVTSFDLVDNPALRFLPVDSQVLGQLYWAGEAGWEPELLPWWRRFCRGADAVLELGAVADAGISSVSLHVPADQQATPTIAFLPADTELPADMARDVRAVIDVPAVDVRSLLDGVDVIKLDVEGQEHLLLEAARDHLRARRPALFVEVLPGTDRLRALLADLCSSDGYRCYALTRRDAVELALEDLATIRLMDRFGCQDVLLSATALPEA